MSLPHTAGEITKGVQPPGSKTQQRLSKPQIHNPCCPWIPSLVVYPADRLLSMQNDIGSKSFTTTTDEKQPTLPLRKEQLSKLRAREGMLWQH